MISRHSHLTESSKSISLSHKGCILNPQDSHNILEQNIKNIHDDLVKRIDKLHEKVDENDERYQHEIKGIEERLDILREKDEQIVKMSKDQLELFKKAFND